MPDYADLLIRLYSYDKKFHGIELSYFHFDSVIEADSVNGKVEIKRLKALEGVEIKDPYAYGEKLKKALFADPLLEKYIIKVLGNVEGKDITLRLRLRIPMELKHLQNLHWETMPGVNGARSVSRDQNHPFSRFLPMKDWRQIHLRPKTELRALVVVSNPKELEEKSQPLITHLADKVNEPQQMILAKVDVPGETRRAKDALKGVRSIDKLHSLNPQARPTLENIKSHLLNGYDVLYLVCHGALIAKPDQPVGQDNPRLPMLVLENSQGSLTVENGKDLADAIHSLEANLRPRLVVLASCQSGGDGSSKDQGALSAIGPLLVRAGVPAVVAMQGDVLMETSNKFFSHFFKQLVEHGSLDKAMAAARMAIDQLDDWWVPVLFTCLKGGQLLYNLGFSELETDFYLWPNLIQNIRHIEYKWDEKIVEHRCTPVIGPDLSRFLIGSPREIARQWADPVNFTHGPEVLGSLPSVANYLSANPHDLPYFAQYLAVQQSHEFVPKDMINHLRSRLIRENKDYLPSEILNEDVPNLRHVIAALGARQHALNGDSYAYHILAKLPFKIYINANPDNLLEEALVAHGRKPRIEYFQWNPTLGKQVYTHLGMQSDYVPSEENPLIFHMYGDFRNEKSLVLTEDDYFEYLVNINSGRLPEDIETILTSHTLLFLGFRLSDWNFRVLFHSLLDEDRKQKRQELIGDNKSIAVQLQPSDQITRPELVRSFLEKYLPPEFKIYWGPADLFLIDLLEKYQKDPKKKVFQCQINKPQES